jgi:plasmid stability protein
MPTLTVKNIPGDLYAQLKQSAEINHRSLNSEIIVCIERSIRSNKANPEAVLARARKLRARTISHPITDDEFSQAKTAGRL